MLERMDSNRILRETIVNLFEARRHQLSSLRPLVVLRFHFPRPFVGTVGYIDIVVAGPKVISGKSSRVVTLILRDLSLSTAIYASMPAMYSCSGFVS